MYLGQHDTDQWGVCHDVLLISPFPRDVGIAKLTISPDLGFAVVEKTRLNVWRPEPETGEGAKPYRGYHVAYQDFSEVSDRIHCAHTTQVDWFDLSVGEKMRAWGYTTIYRLTELRVNGRTEETGLYRFPFDTLVTDATQRPPSLKPVLGAYDVSAASPKASWADFQGVLDLLQRAGQTALREPPGG